MTVSLDVQEDIRRMDRDGATRADIARELAGFVWALARMAG